MYDEKNYPVGLQKKYVLGTTATLTPDFPFMPQSIRRSWNQFQTLYSD